MKHFLFIILIGLFAFPALAQNTTKFSFPVECELGENCWFAQYVDVDPSPETHKDFKCTARTYEDHKGTDIALRNRTVMKDGVNVLAAADGKILRVRNGESDSLKTEEQYQTITAANKDCGNGIIIDHGAGLLTYYCHLKNASITVTPDQEVERGDVIAQIGQSGLAEFPHLHFTVIWEGGHIDPFTGLLKEDGCGKFKTNMWSDALTYDRYALYDGGFSSKLPDFKTIENGTYAAPPITLASESFVFWTSFYQIQKGDEITLSVKDPDGKIFITRTIVQEKNRARQHYYTGRKLKNAPLKTGTYTATATIKAEGFPPLTKTFETTVK